MNLIQSLWVLLSGARCRLSQIQTKCLFVLCALSDVKFEIDLPKKLVWIESDRDVEVLMETLKKCGKEVKYNGTK